MSPVGNGGGAVWLACEQVVRLPAMQRRAHTAAREWHRHLMAMYVARTPTYERAVASTRRATLSGRALRVEHIAVRSLCMPQCNLGMAPLARIARARGYEPRELFRCEATHVRGQWFAPPTPRRGDDDDENDDAALPRLSMSELCVGDLSTEAQRIVSRYVSMHSPLAGIGATECEKGLGPRQAASLSAHAMDVALRTSPPSRLHYERLRTESAYAAWALLNGHRVHHCALDIGTLRAPWNEMSPFVALAQRTLGIAMADDDDGKGDDGAWLQAQTRAELVPIRFDGETEHSVLPGTSVVFVQRRRT